MSLEEINKLELRLRQPLPGTLAHEKMRPRLPNGENLRFSERVNPRPGAVLILFYQRQNRWFFPLIQRPTYNGVHSGEIGLPGGKQEPADRDLYATAIREAREEIGIDPARVKVIGALSPFFVAASNHEVLPVVGVYASIPEFIPDEVEVAEIIEAPLEDLLHAGNVKETEIVTALGFRLLSPYFDINGKVVWGATAGMLSELKEIMS